MQLSISEIDFMNHRISFIRGWWERREGESSNLRRHRGVFLFMVPTYVFVIMIALSVAAMEKNDIIDIIDKKRKNQGDRMLQLQSPIPIPGGEVTRHRFRMHTSHYLGSKSGKGSKSSSSKSGKSTMTMIVYQPVYMTPPTIHYQPTKTETPTAAPEEATDLPTYRPSVSSSMDETFSSTAELMTVNRQNLQMSLFGISKSVLDVNEQRYFERQTAIYMEEFYKKSDGRDGLLDAIKDEVDNVEVAVTIDDQEYKYTDELRDGMNRTLAFNETHTSVNGDRSLQISTQVSEPCEGTNPLILTLSVEISYRLSSGKYPIESDAVISFPFSSVPYRQKYIDDYLKNNGAGDGSEETDEESNIEDDEQDGAVFADVYCTSHIDTETDSSEPPTSALTPTDIPTLSPALDETLTPSKLPSTLPSMLPTILSTAPTLKTSPPTLPATLAQTGIPSTSKVAEATYRPTMSDLPTMSELSTAPSQGNGAATAVPSTKSSARLATVAPTSAVPTPSQFSLSVGPSLGTSNSGTAVPTSNITSQVTSDAPTVVFEDNIGPADSLSVVEESLGLTLSPRPSTLEEDVTIVPTVSTFLNAAPTRATSNPPTMQDSNRPTFSTSSNQTGVEADISDVPSQSSSSGAVSDQLEFSVTTPPPTNNGKFGNLRVADSAVNERICSDTRGLAPDNKRDETDVAFMYGVEYSSEDIHDYIDDMETMILDLVSKSILKCATEKKGADAVESRKLEESENVYEGVIGVRYPEFGKITSISYCEIFTTLQASGCAILISKLIITFVGVPNVEVHHDILLILEDIFKASRIVEGVPPLLSTSFLGPDPSALALSSVLISEQNGAQRGISSFLLLAILLGCSLMHSM